MEMGYFSRNWDVDTLTSTPGYSIEDFLILHR
jgi:hypothetical protein